MQIHNAAVTGSFTYNGIDISDITGSEQSVTSLNDFSASILNYTSSNNQSIASLNAASASLFAATASLSEATASLFNYTSSNNDSIADIRVATASLYAVTASINSYTASNNANIASLYAATASIYNATSSIYGATSSLFNFSSSATLRINALDQYTASLNTRSASFACIDSTNNFACSQYFSNASNAISFTSTGSLYSDGGVRITRDMYVSGTAFFNNVTVFGTQSINYISSSQLNIASNIISVNTATPTVRFGGLAVYDSGSLGTGLTGSILWDSEANHWVYSNPSGSAYDGGMLISGPRNSSGLGNEQGTTACMLLAGQGGDHLTSSAIYHSTTVTCIPNAIVGGSTACFACQICAPIISANSGYFSSQICSTGNSNTFGAAGSPGRAVVIQAGCVNQAIQFKNCSGGDGTLYAEGTSTSLNYRFDTYSTSNALYIANGGNVGIGTNSPVTALHVFKTAYTGNQIKTYAELQSAPVSLTYSTSDGFGLILNMYEAVAGNPYTRYADIVASTGDVSDSAIRFFTKSYNANPSERLRITAAGIACFSSTVCAPNILSSGCIGIGITSPGAKLEINADGGGLNGFTGLKLKYGTTSVQSLSMGQVTAGNGAWIGMAQYRLSGFWQTEGTAAGVINLSSDGTISFSTNCGLTANTDYNLSERFKITPTGEACFACQVCAPVTIISGCASIGTVSTINTNTVLKVKALAEPAGISSSSAIFIVTRQATDTQLGIGYYTTPDAWVISSTYGSNGAYKPLVIATSDTERLRITSDGIACFACQVCVPSLYSAFLFACTSTALDNTLTNTTLTLEQRFGDVTSGGDYQGGSLLLMNNNGSSTWAGGAITATVGTTACTGGFPGGLAFWVKSANGGTGTSGINQAMRIDWSGRVGIGTTTPGAKLDIVGAGSGLALSFGNTVANNPLYFNFYGGWSGIGMDQTTAGMRLAGDITEPNPIVQFGYYKGSTALHACWCQKAVITSAGVGCFSSRVCANGFSQNATLNGNYYSMDVTPNMCLVPAGECIHFCNMSGMVVVNDWNDGSVTIYLGGGGSTSTVGCVTAKTGCFWYNLGIGGYTWSNTSGANRCYGFYVVRTRTTA